MYKLLLDEPPLVVLPSLAKAIGLNESIILQQVHYWLVNAREAKRRENFKQGRWWVYHTYPEWAATFPFWSEITIKRTFLELEKRGLVLSAQLSEDRWNRSKWYTIDYDLYSATIEAMLEQRQEPMDGEATGADESTSDQIDTLHRIKTIRSKSSHRYDPSDQSGPLQKVKLLRSKGEKTTPKTTEQTTAEKTYDDNLTDNAAADPSLVLELVNAGLNRSDALRLAASNPEECRRQLAYLPYVKEFKTSPGAYLRRGIEQGFAAPAAWTEEQARAANVQRRDAQGKARDAAMTETADAAAKIETEKARLQTENPGAWEQIVASARELVPASIAKRPNGPTYQGALDGYIRQIMAEKIGMG